MPSRAARMTPPGARTDSPRAMSPDAAPGWRTPETAGPAAASRTASAPDARDRIRAGQHRLRRGRGPPQHGDRDGRRRVRPRHPPHLHRPAPRLHDPLVRMAELLHRLRLPDRHRPRRVHRERARARRAACRGHHPLSRRVLRQQHLVRHLPAVGAGMVRVRLPARPHPAPGGPLPARHRLGKLPRLHRRRDRAHRLRASRSLRVHRGPDRRRPGARRRAEGRTGAVMRDRIRDFYRQGN